HGFIIGHITPEAQSGGPLGLIRNGDRITIDAETRRIDADVTEAEMEQRRKEWVEPPLKASKGTLFKYIKTVKTASFGCVTD
ncbi:dihydroxy-acid dehydratase ilv3, partial [Coemansia sp. RSA 921]